MIRAASVRRAAGARGAAGRIRLAACVVAALLGAGCHSDMYDQPKLRPLEASEFFADGNSSRPLPEGTVARGQLHAPDAMHTGRAGGELAPDFPVAITADLLARGRERYEIFCSICHDRVGDGEGMIVRRGFKPPPSFHIDRLRAAPPGHYFDVMTNGLGAMYHYRTRLSPEERWAVAAYVRALQWSQHAPVADLPAADRGALERRKDEEP